MLSGQSWMKHLAGIKRYDKNAKQVHRTRLRFPSPVPLRRDELVFQWLWIKFILKLFKIFVKIMSTNSFSKDFFNIKGKNAEELIHELATKSFFIDWCFPNPKLPDNKELCDLLVIFDDIAIIFQIKNLKLKNGKYNKSEVKKNIKQLSGARRQLFDLKTSVNLANSRRRPELFDPSAIKKIFLISVLVGEGEDFSNFMDEVKNNSVHVFTSDFAKIVFKELDTIKDFADYLQEKENLINNKQYMIIQGGEEELLAYYLANERTFQGIEKSDFVHFTGGSWESFKSEERYKAKKEADKISYGWDSLIEKAHEGSEKYELVARELARPSRLQRRSLSKMFYDAQVFAHNKINDKINIIRRVVSPDNSDTTYCFVFIDNFESIDKEAIENLLFSTCHVARGIYKKPKVLGIATEGKFNRMISYDFCYTYQADWNEQDQKIMEQLQQKYGILTNIKTGNLIECEYPI